MTTKTAIFILSGGFHNSPATTIRVPRHMLRGGWSRDEVLANLSNRQRARLARHFCGVSGCMCGGPYRANMQLISHRFVPA